MNEEGIIKEIIRIIHSEIPSHPQLLIRCNPMESGERFNFCKDDTDVVIQRPNWEWSPECSWNAPLKQDVSSWISTVFHSAGKSFYSFDCNPRVWFAK